MKINEAAAQAGMTAKNIRFYEAQGLLEPPRNAGNRYRDYGPEEVTLLRRIRLLRMLDLPIAEIRAILAGEQSLQSGLARHLVLLESRQLSLDAARELCRELSSENIGLDALDPQRYLDQAARHQQKGACFVDVSKQDQKRKRYLGAALGAGAYLALMALVIWLELWAFFTDPAGAPPLPLMALLVGLPAVTMVGAVAALVGRFQEIQKGEADDYRNY